MEKLIILRVIDNKSIPDSSIDAMGSVLKGYNSKSVMYFAESIEHGLRVLIGNQAAKDAMDDLTKAAEAMEKGKH